MKSKIDIEMQILLDVNLVNATIQANEQMIERLISMGASITSRNREEHSAKDAIFTSIYFQDDKTLNFLFQMDKKYNNHTEFIKDQVIYEYLSVNFKNDNANILKVFKENNFLNKFFTIEKELFYKCLVFAPHCLTFMLEDYPHLFGDIHFQVQISKMFASALKKQTHEHHPAMKEVMSIIYQYDNQSVNDYFVNALEINEKFFENESAPFQLIDEIEESKIDENMIYYLMDLGINIKKSLKELVPQNETHFVVKNADKCFVDFIEDLTLKANIEKKYLEDTLNYNEKIIKKIKV